MDDNPRLTAKQKAVVEVLRQGRATPKHIVDSSSAVPSKYSAQDHLKELRAKGLVEKVNKGLYELVEDPAEDTGSEAVLEALIEAVDDTDSITVDADAFEFPTEGGENR